MRCESRAPPSARARTCRSSGAAGIPRCSAANAWPSPRVDVTVQGQGEETFAEIVRASRGPLARRLRGLHGAVAPTARCCANPPRAAAAARDVPRARLSADPGRALLRAQGQAAARLHLLAGLQLPLRVLLGSVRLRTQVGGPRSRARWCCELRELWDRYRFDDVNFQDETFFTRRDRVQAHRASRSSTRGMKITWAGDDARRSGRAAAGRRLGAVQAVRPAQAAGRRRVGLERDAQAHPQGHHDRAGVPHGARRCATTASPGIFRSSSAFRTRATTSIARRSTCAKRLRAMSPDFETPFFYFKPYPGSEIVTEAVARGFRLPDTLEAWSRVRLRRRPAGSVGHARKVSSSSSASSSSTIWPGSAIRGKAGCSGSLAIAAGATTIACPSRCC